MSPAGCYVIGGTFMPLAAFADFAQVISAIAVVVSLGYVAIQLQLHTRQMRRGEANSAMMHGSAIRHLVLNNRDVAELVVAGTGEMRPLDPVDEYRLGVFFAEIAYMAFQIWDRTRNGLAPPDEFQRTSLLFSRTLATPRGVAWWRRFRGVYQTEFVTAIEAVLPALAQQAEQGLGAPTTSVRASQAAAAG